MTKIALDTNVLIYNHNMEDVDKRTIAQKLLTMHPSISGQVISEYLNVMKRSFPIAKMDLMDLCTQWIEKCSIQPVDISTLKMAKRLIQRYDFQIFDSIIVASAVEAGCDVLYSEDMQHNLEVEKQLRIINPFR
ncbi:MAG: PIN domain-containing protein [Candidatus Symbiothrix sp.]|jgi:predicted nucleic acid-binding protein|nr:PIN domain-containing protein [Candidatus Symbiothrix sp.]